MFFCNDLVSQAKEDWGIVKRCLQRTGWVLPELCWDHKCCGCGDCWIYWWGVVAGFDRCACRVSKSGGEGRFMPCVRRRWVVDAMRLFETVWVENRSILCLYAWVGIGFHGSTEALGYL